MEVLTFIGYLLLRRSILVVVIIGGMVFAATRWKRHPRVSLLTLIGLGFYLIESWCFAFLFHYLPRWFETLRLTPKTISLFDSAFQLLDDFSFAVVVILLVAAGLSQRKHLNY